MSFCVTARLLLVQIKSTKQYKDSKLIPINVGMSLASAQCFSHKTLFCKFPEEVTNINIVRFDHDDVYVEDGYMMLVSRSTTDDTSRVFVVREARELQCKSLEKGKPYDIQTEYYNIVKTKHKDAFDKEGHVMNAIYQGINMTQFSGIQHVFKVKEKYDVFVEDMDIYDNKVVCSASAQRDIGV
jgi:hypothetical protein